VTDPTDAGGRPWSASPSAKTRNAVQRAVTALLDELAPERVLTRGEQIRLPVEQHRTPTGCVLQAPSAAVSVSWFAEASADAELGELHVIVWRGTVSRRGSKRERATTVKELVLRPVERPGGESGWRATDGTEYDTPSLAAHCVALLEAQMRETKPGGA
jgi:hypothetical protein